MPIQFKQVVTKLRQQFGIQATKRRSRGVLETQNGELLEARCLLSGTTSGEDVLVNTNVADRLNNQGDTVVASDAVGNYVVVWEGQTRDGSHYGIFAQRFAANGDRIGGEFQVNELSDNDQGNPSIAMDSVGNFVIAWESNRTPNNSYDIFARRYSLFGAPQGREFQVNDVHQAGYQGSPSVAMNESGNFVIAWETEVQSAGYKDVHARHYFANGTARGEEFKVNSITFDQQQDPSVAMSNAGGIVITWESGHRDGDNFDIRGQRYDANGNPRGSELQINSTIAFDQGNPVVAMDSDGDFTVAWQSQTSFGSYYDIFARRFDETGSAVGGDVVVNSFRPFNQSDPSIAMTNNGDYVITWESQLQDNNKYGIFGQCFDSSGNKKSGEFRVNETTIGDQANPDVAIDNYGDFVVAWESEDTSRSTYDIYSRQYFSSGGTAEITVSANGNIIVDGDTSPSLQDRTDFGSAILGGNAVENVFVIKNDGSSNLTISNIQVPDGFSIVDPPSSTISPGEYEILTIAMETQSVGVNGGDVVFSTNDADEARFNFKIQGTVERYLTQTTGTGVVLYEGNGQWSVARTGFTGVTRIAGPRWSAAAGWSVYQGDFNGDGLTDIAGRQASGQWYVGLNTGQTGFSVSYWGRWSPNTYASWKNVMVTDVNGDGRADMLGQDRVGQWWAATSTGSRFATQYMGRWSATAYSEIVSGDFNGDGRTDIAGFQSTNGQWWFGYSTGGRFTTRYAGRWNPNSQFANMKVGDFTGNGKDEVAAQDKDGRWYIGWINNSLRIQSYYGARWGETNAEAYVGDFNGDGKQDLATLNANGAWWVSQSNGRNQAMTNKYFGEGMTGGIYTVLDVNKDGTDDIIGLRHSTGQWTAALSQTTKFYFHNIGRWLPMNRPTHFKGGDVSSPIVF